MFAGRLFRTRPAVAAGRALFASAAAQARHPALYSGLGAPDTVLGRFELYTVHVILLVRRLKGQGAGAQETAQALFDAYVENLDIALREMGVGDLSMGKKMKKLGQAFYGRVRTYEAALAGQDDLDGVLARTVFDGVAGADPRPLARYVRQAAAGLTELGNDELLAGEAKWPEAAA